VSLAIFNMIPIPPLDGSRVVDGLVPHGWRRQWESIVRLSPILLIVVVVAGGRFIAGPASAVVGWLGRLVVAMQS
jgi:Zn-dependent protease